jgi:hypothetical protein
MKKTTKKPAARKTATKKPAARTSTLKKPPAKYEPKPLETLGRAPFHYPPK